MTINVKGYGAVGNGVTDDALAINTALLASSATGQEVFFPPGTYLLGATLTVGPGTHLKLTGNAASIKFASNTRAAIQLSVLTGTGTSLAVSSGTVTLTAAASVFTAAHVGRTLVINSATNSANNGIFVVASYVSATQITYANASGVNETSSFTWSLATQDISIRDLGFQGDSSDDYTVNTNPAILIVDNVSDIEVFHCTFDHCTPIMANDSYVSRRLQFVGNYVHNAPNGLHPPSDSSITDSDFVCDSIVSTRAQAIYSYGQQTNLLIANCRFKNIAAETIQIRASASRYQLRNGFRIVGNHFETCDSYAVWVGSDDHPDIGETVISNNTFRNCNGPIQAQGNRSVVINGNHIEYDWEWPFARSGSGSAIVVTGGIGLSGHYNTARGAVISNNKVMVHHPWVGKVTVNSVPANLDTVTVGDFTYTWKTSATADGDVAIGADTRACAENLRTSIAGLDGRATAPCDVLRYVTDVFNNYYGNVYGTNDSNVVVISSFNTFTLSATGTALTLTAAADYRSAIGNAINVTTCIAPLIEGNVLDDCPSGIALTQNYQPTIRNNVFTYQSSSLAPFGSTGNVLSSYSGNRLVGLHAQQQTRPYYASISDGFPVIEDPWILTQQFTTPALFGRAGVVPVSDGKAHTYLYYGMEVAGIVDATTRPYRWDDGDTINIYYSSTSHLLTFKRVSPGTGQFNSADSLITAINALGTVSAAYAPYENDLAGSNPKLMIKVYFTSAGTVDPAGALLGVYRYKKPSDTTTYRTVPQPLLNGVILRNRTPGVDDESARFRGGVSPITLTFVHTPIANASLPVTVTGVDANSQGLSPVVYQGDIIPGVGFGITHTAPGVGPYGGFFWRVGA